jgi:exosortase sorting signal-containing protein
MRRIARAIVLVAAVFASAAHAAVVFTNLGTSAPPATISGSTVAPFDQAAQAAIANGTPVTTIPGSPIGGSLTVSPAAEKRTIGAGWATWSHGYTGPVFVVLASSATLTLPAGTRAFYFYAEPNAFAIQTVSATTNSGATSGPINVDGQAGANGFAFITTAGETISTITVTTNDSSFALAEFGASAAGATPPAPVPTLSEWALIGLALLLAGVAALRLRRFR